MYILQSLGIKIHFPGESSYPWVNLLDNGHYDKGHAVFLIFFPLFSNFGKFQ